MIGVVGVGLLTTEEFAAVTGPTETVDEAGEDVASTVEAGEDIASTVEEFVETSGTPVESEIGDEVEVELFSVVAGALIMGIDCGKVPLMVSFAKLPQ